MLTKELKSRFDDISKIWTEQDVRQAQLYREGKATINPSADRLDCLIRFEIEVQHRNFLLLFLEPILSHVRISDIFQRTKELIGILGRIHHSITNGDLRAPYTAEQFEQYVAALLPCFSTQPADEEIRIFFQRFLTGEVRDYDEYEFRIVELEWSDGY